MSTSPSNKAGDSDDNHRLLATATSHCSSLQREPAPGDSSPPFDLQSSEETAPILAGSGIQESLTEEELLERRVVAKLDRHLMVLFFALTILCYIDRTNLAFAALQLNSDLDFSHRVYALGSGVFFFTGYIAFQVPSNVLILRLGGRIWLGALVTLWGLLAAAFAAVSGPAEFYFLRLLLGAAESGTMPGMWYVMSLFYAQMELTVSWAYVLIGIAISQVIGGPLAAAFLAMDGLFGLRGWQVLFLVEGLLAVVAGAVTFFSLADSPAKAKFLTVEEREWLHKRNEALRAAAVSSGAKETTKAAAYDLRTWHLAAISLLANIPKYGVIFWCPLIIQAVLGTTSGSDSTGDAVVALLTALPYCISAATIYLNSAHSKKSGERHLHVAIPLLVAACAFVSLALLINTTPIGAFAALLLLAVVWAPDAVMASWPATFLQGPAAATGVALINSVGSIGGIIGPTLIGFLAEAPSDYPLPLMILAAVAVAVSGLAMVFPREGRPKDHGSDSSTPPGAGEP